MPANVMDLLVCLFIRSNDKVEKLWNFSLRQNEVDTISEMNVSWRITPNEEMRSFT